MKIISTVELQAAHRALITAAVPGAELLDRQCRSPEEFSELVSGGCDVLLTFRMPRDLFDRAPGLRWIQLLSAGADHALSGPLKGSSIPLTTASGIHATPIAEYTLGSMLAYTHRIHLAIRAQIRHQWTRSRNLKEPIDETPRAYDWHHRLWIDRKGDCAAGARIRDERAGAQARPRESARLGLVSAGAGRSRRLDTCTVVRSRAIARIFCVRCDYVSVTLPLSDAHAEIHRRARNRRDETRRVPRQHRTRPSDR